MIPILYTPLTQRNHLLSPQLKTTLKFKMIGAKVKWLVLSLSLFPYIKAGHIVCFVSAFLLGINCSGEGTYYLFYAVLKQC